MNASVPVTATIGAAVAALVLADVLCEALRRLAIAHGFTDRPDPRKAHARPTPYLGGVAIAAGTLVSACALVPHWNRQVVAAAVAGAAVALLGLVDDLRPLTRPTRLAAEAVAACAVVACGGRISLFGGWVDPVLTVVWIVVITNSFNLLDNMDGAVAGIAAASAGLVAVTASLSGQGGLVVLLLALAGGSVGFGVHNWAPARMFMGDAGSLFIGFVLSSALVMIHVPGGAAARMAELFLCTFVATVDTWLVLIARPMAGISWLMAGTDHVSHRLHRTGLSVRQVAAAQFGTTVVTCLCGVLVAFRLLPGLGTFTVAAASGTAAILFLLKVPIYAVRAQDTVNSGA